jgi:heat shock transcription factor
MDGYTHARNSFGLGLTPPQYPQPVPTPSNSLARRQMNYVPTNPRTTFNGSVDVWGNFVGGKNALLPHNPPENPPENLNDQDNVELLEDMAQKAKREAQAKRKQIPPFVQKLSR